ncbi:hypothetical protein Q9L58_006253 [Maublancomyces gigas]|uniref:Protein kinase domain-containing protein n=1 Tax=Discina gigas TaxID=1032678 RepID=A0ABR3GFX7_9PEZI
MSIPVSKLDHFKMETEFGRDFVINTTAGWNLSTKQNRRTKWHRQRLLGTGGFGSVWLEQEENGSQLRAVKKLQRQDVMRMSFTHELVALITLADHRHLFVEFFGWYEDPENIFLAMEYIEHGDLSQYLKSKKIPTAHVKEITTQVLEGLVVLHAEGICHRDLKPQNILLVSRDPLWVKIADFGASKRLAHTALRTMCGTQGYLAPELLRLQPRTFQTGCSDEFTYALDIWSLGCLVHELLTGETPFREAQNDEDWQVESGFTTLEPQTDMGKLYEYCHGTCRFPVELLQSSDVAQNGVEFVASLLAANPNDRPTAARAQHHPWLASVGYASNWFTGLKRECRELRLDLYFGSRADKTLMRQLRTRDIANYLRNVRQGEAPLTTLLDRALSTKSHLLASMLVTSPIRRLEDPAGMKLKDLFERGVRAGLVGRTKVVLPGLRDVDFTFRNGGTGLHLAVQRGHTGVAELLLKSGANRMIKMKRGRTVLEVAVDNKQIDMVQVLLHSNADVNNCLSEEDVSTMFRTAVKNGAIEVVELLLANKVGVDTRVDGQTFLQMAVANGQTGIMRLLLQNNADVNSASENGETALGTAARNGCIDVMKLLLEWNVDVNAENKQQPLLRLPPKAETSDEDLRNESNQRRYMADDVGLIYSDIALSIRPHAESDQASSLMDDDGRLPRISEDDIPNHDVARTALQTAAENGHTGMVQLLLDNHAKVNAGTGSHTALRAAVERNNTDIVKLLLDSQADPDPKPAGKDDRTIIQVAVERKNIEIVELLLAHNVDANAKPSNENSRTVLERAIGKRDIDMVKLLLRNGVDVNLQIGVRTPLVAAIQSNDIDIVQLLLENKADINDKNSDPTALEAAATRGYIEIMKLLLRNDADVNSKSSENGRTALQGAARQGHLDSVKLLLENNVEVNASSSGEDGRTALHEAAWNGHIDVVQLLLNNKANVNDVPPVRGRTALRCAAERGHTGIVKLLLSNKADINTHSPPGSWTALHAATMSSNIEPVKLLLKLKCDVNAKASNGQTALQMAVGNGDCNIVDLLLSYSAKISDDNRELRIAANNGFIDIAKLLTDNQVAADTRDARWARIRTDLLLFVLVTMLQHPKSALKVKASETAGQIPLPAVYPLRMAGLLLSQLKAAGSRDTGWALSFAIAALSLKVGAKSKPSEHSSWRLLVNSVFYKAGISLIFTLGARTRPKQVRHKTWWPAIVERLVLDWITEVMDTGRFKGTRDWIPNTTEPLMTMIVKLWVMHSCGKPFKYTNVLAYLAGPLGESILLHFSDRIKSTRASDSFREQGLEQIIELVHRRILTTEWLYVPNLRETSLLTAALSTHVL